MLTKEQEEKAREIAADITERATNGEFGWRYGIKADISWEELQKLRESPPPVLRFVDGEYIPIEEET